MRIRLSRLGLWWLYSIRLNRLFLLTWSHINCYLHIYVNAVYLSLTGFEICDRLISIPRLLATVPLDLIVRTSPSVISELPDNGGLLSILVLFFLLDLTSPVSVAFLFCVSTFIAADSAFCIFLTAFSAVSMSVPNCSCTYYTKTAVAASFCFTTLPRRIPVSFRHAATMPHTAAKRNRRPDHSEKRQFHPF